MNDGANETSERELNDTGFDYVELLVAGSLVGAISVWAQLGCLAACYLVTHL